MQCGSCGEEIPADSIFCPECGARQDLSRAGGFTAPNAVGLSGQEVTGGRSFGVVSGEAIRHQREMSVTDPNAVSPELMRQIAQSMQNQQNIPPVGNFPPQGYQNPINQQNNLNQQMPMNNLGKYAPSNVQNVTPVNPSTSPTDEMVNRLAEAEKAMKSERRNQWLNMNQASASNVLSNLGADLPNHLRNETNAAQEILSGALGGQKDAPNDAFLRRMCEVAVRRVARKRGVAVETPQAKLDDGILTVNITYIDDGRVLDTPDELTQAFEHAIQTEIALKGFDYVAEINLYRSKDGEIENLSEEEQEEDEEMFACEICDGLVKESDNECPHCGAIFEDEEEDEPVAPSEATKGSIQTKAVHPEAVLQAVLPEAVLPEAVLQAVLPEAVLQAVLPEAVLRAALQEVRADLLHPSQPAHLVDLHGPQEVLVEALHLVAQKVVHRRVQNVALQNE